MDTKQNILKNDAKIAGLTFASICFLAIVLLLAISDILMPFIVALAMAYFLDPAADKLESFGMSRAVATTVITVIFFIIVMITLALILPMFYDQIISFIKNIPRYVEALNSEILPKFDSYISMLDAEDIEKVKQSVSGMAGNVVSMLGKVAGSIWNSSMAVVNLFSLIFITPIVTFYALRDWDKMTSKVKCWLPPKYAPAIQKRLAEIDTTLSGYIRGQTNVCLFLAVFYGVGLSLAGLDFAMFIGIATGVLSFIPYVGTLFGFTTGILVAFFQFDEWTRIAVIAAIFIAGQMIEGTIVTPNLVGNKVGLHPMWIIFGLLAGGTLFGFTGMLLAIPVTAVIGVLLRAALGYYLESAVFETSSSKKGQAVEM